MWNQAKIVKCHKIKYTKIEGSLDNEDNRKKIWANLKKYLPLYSLFFVDNPLNDQDSDVQDPMKKIIKEVLSRDVITPLLDKLKEAVKVASTSMAEKTIEKFNELDTVSSETLCSEFSKEPSWNSIFKLSLEDDRGIPLNKRGSGMRRLVLLSFFRTQVEKRKTEKAPNIIYALEEPETSQHPDFQLMVVNALKELSETDNAQVLLYDSDVADYVKSVTDLNAEGNPSKIGYNTSKSELENYLHHEAINKCYADQNININITEVLDNDDIPLKVATKVYQVRGVSDWNNINPDPVKNEKKQKTKVSQSKKLLNNAAVAKMTVERLKDRNGYDEIRIWLDKIKEYIES